MAKIPMKVVYNGFLYDFEAPKTIPHNAEYRGKSLGAFTDAYANAVANLQFTDMYVGDTFTQNGHTYKIGGINYLFGTDHNDYLPPHLLMITDALGIHEMNPSATTSGGFAGSEMWKSYFPTLVQQLKADFGNHLLTWNEYLTTGTDGNAANQGEYFSVQASMMNTVMYWGHPTDYSNDSVDGNNYNIGIETKQLPIMKLHPDEQKNDGQWTWQRDICNNASFADAEPNGTASSANANYNGNVRAFFLIG